MCQGSSSPILHGPEAMGAFAVSPDPSPAASQADAFGKAILVGEHAVIYGASAIALPVKSVGMRVRLTPLLASSTYPHQHGQSPVTIKASLGGRGVSEHLKSIIFEAFEILKVTPFSLEFEGVSSGLIGAGMGSSATLCVVIIKSMARALGMHLEADQLALYANRLERHFHGNPSGLDAAVVAYEKPIWFRKGQLPEILTGPSPLRGPESRSRIPSPPTSEETWPFVLLDSQTRSSTIAMVKGVAPYFTSTGKGTERIERFDRIALDVRHGLKGGDPLAVAAGMNEASRYLKEAGASSPVLEDLETLCQNLGVLAAKPTGAGGGGCVLALLDVTHQSEQLAALRQQLGAERVISVNGSNA